MKKKELLITALIIMFSMQTVKAFEISKEVNEQMRINNFMSQASDELKSLYENQKFVINSDWFDSKGNLLPTIKLDAIYIATKTHYDKYGTVVGTVNESITKDEFVSLSNTEAIIGNCSGVSFVNDCWETSTKRLTIAVLANPGYPNVKIAVINNWKTMPSIKSYDTIGLLYNGFTMSTAYGYQYYNTLSNQNSQSISYSYNGTNMKIGTGTWKGVSISQNIVDDVYNYLENQLWVPGTLALSGPIQFTASYQHAVTNISLTTSKYFDFSPSGMGRVFSWNTSYSNWDNMQGVCANLSSYVWFC